MAVPEWLTAMVPFVKDAKTWEILQQHVHLLTAQRDDAIKELDKSDAALAQAKGTIADLQHQLDDLKKEVGILTPPKNLANETVEVLRVFFEKDAALPPEYIARARKLKPSIAKYHCDKLMDLGFLWLGTAGWADEPMPYILTDKGRAYLVDNGLV